MNKVEDSQSNLQNKFRNLVGLVRFKTVKLAGIVIRELPIKQSLRIAKKMLNSRCLR